jgi:hypothetical protein
MQVIFGLLYTFLFLSYIVTALFIVFHLLRYSIDRKSAVVTVTFFLSIFGILLFLNALTFFSLPLAELLPPSAY